MNDVKNLRDFRENRLLKMESKDKESAFSDFVKKVKQINLDREEQLEALYKIRGIK